VQRVPVGETCETGTCVLGAWCEQGNCVEPVGLGDTCDWNQSESCAAPLVCKFETDTCVEPSNEGEPCHDSLDGLRSSCATGLGCDTLDGVCEKIRGVNEPCSDAAQCEAEMCQLADDGLGPSCGLHRCR